MQKLSKLNLRELYLYTVCFITLMVLMFSTIGFLNLAIKTAFFPEADVYYVKGERPYEVGPDGKTIERSEEQEKKEEAAAKERALRQRQNDIANWSAMAIVALPLFLFHQRKLKL